VIDESVLLEPGALESEIPAFVDQCLIDSTKKAEAERRCNVLKSDIFKSKINVLRVYVLEIPNVLIFLSQK
jgi:hypothetical protein